MTVAARSAPDTAETRSAYTPRQAAVLASALELLVSGGEKALTTAGIARAASCSKESLYKWFGDRDGLLAAVIGFQAAKVRPRSTDTATRDLAAYRVELEAFATDLLTVLNGDVSIALNRLAIGQASRDDARLGKLLIERGRKPVRERARALIDAGRAAGLLAVADAEHATRTFYGLIVGDMHVSLLLGADVRASDSEIEATARGAVAHFLTLFGTGSAGAGKSIPTDNPQEN